jgi:surface protein
MSWRTPMILTFSNVPSIALPLYSITGTYQVDWGDGVTTTNTAAYTYSVEGNYTVQISVANDGSSRILRFGNTFFNWTGGSNLTGITDWGDFNGIQTINRLGYTALTAVPATFPSTVTDTRHMFSSASTFNQAIGGWNVSNVTTMLAMFNEASSFNQDIGGWNVSNVINMTSMFFYAQSFNKNIGAWNVSKVTNMSSMFYNTSMSPVNLSLTLFGWNQSVTGPTYASNTITDMLLDKSIYPFGNTALTELKTSKSWSGAQSGTVLTADGPGSMLLLQFADVSNNDVIQLPLYDISGSYTVTWGDGSAPITYTTETPSNTYTNSSPTDYIVQIDISNNGSFIKQFGNTNSTWTGHDKLNWFISFGDTVGLQRINRLGAAALTAAPATLPSTVTNTSYMFYQATTFNGNIVNWNVSNVTTMVYMFYQATSFDKDIGAWDVSKVTDMNGMFYLATVFNGNIGNWALKTSNVINMNGMFYFAEAFNQDISGWNVSNVTNMSDMFYYAQAFNRNIGGWDVRKVTTMSGMFDNAPMFDGNIGVWGSKTSNVITMNGMFLSAQAFTQDIGGWDVSKVTDMSAMFQGATMFNGNIGAWGSKTSNVTTMGDMFRGAILFDGNIGGWAVSKVMNMSGMFRGASAFNQNIGGWDVSQVTTMSNMFFLATSMSPLNLSVTLIGWNTLPSLVTTPILTNMLNGRIIYQSGKNALSGLETKWNQTATVNYTVVPDPILDVAYNQPTTRIYKNNTLITPYTPSLLGTYNSVEFTISQNPSFPLDISLNETTGEISGTPINLITPTNYTITINAYDNGSILIASVSKTINVSVIGIDYNPANYSFIKDVAITPFTPQIVGITVVSYVITPSLPIDLSFNIVTGQIIGIPDIVQPTTSYTITATSTTSELYDATLSLNISDLSYIDLSYAFLKNLVIRDISCVDKTDLYDNARVITITPGLPSGLALNPVNGDISGTPLITQSETPYTLTLTTSSNYTKTIPFGINISDLSYIDLSYAFLKDLVIRDISCVDKTDLHDNARVISTNPALPSGLALNPVNGDISGTPLTTQAETPYTITLTTSSNYTKTIPLGRINISDLSYIDLSYAFLKNLVIRDISCVDKTDLHDNARVITITPALPSGLELNPVNGDISGTPLTVQTETPYTLTLTTSSNYTKSIPLGSINISDLSYIDLSYAFLKDVVIRDINSVNLYDGQADFSMNPVLPSGLALNPVNGDISGTPLTTQAETPYTLTLTTSSNYTKSIPFGINISDLSYIDLSYAFLKNVIIRDISCVDKTDLHDNALVISTNPALPSGLALNPVNGDISGTPLTTQAETPYTITLTTSSNYIKTIPLGRINISDLSYIDLSYAFLKNVIIRDISCVDKTDLYDSLREDITITPALPSGLALNPVNGDISGTPLTTQAETPYTLTLTTSSNYTKSIPFGINISDLSYIDLSYAFLKNVVIRDISCVDKTDLHDNALVISTNPVLPSGLALNPVNGDISGTPLTTQAETPYTITLTTSSNYIKTIPLGRINISDLSYIDLSYAFLKNLVIRDISCVDKTDLHDSLREDITITPALPSGLALNPVNGDISGTPLITQAETPYTLTLTTSSNYTKSIPFGINISDLSYIDLSYAFLKDVVIRDISCVDKTDLHDNARVISTNPVLPSGLVLNPVNGDISGTPLTVQAETPYTITLTTSSNYTKTIPLGRINISDLSYIDLSYAFLKNLVIRDISCVDKTDLHDSLREDITITPSLPSGLALNPVNGDISGTPLTTQAETPYTLTLTTSSNYTKSIPFGINISDLSYIDLSYAFLKNVVIRDISCVDKTDLNDNALVISTNPALPSGLALNPINGDISGTPLTAQAETPYTLTLTTSSNYTSLPLVFHISVSDISYTVLNYVYLQNQEFLYLPEIKRGSPIEPTIYSPVFKSLLFNPPLPTNLSIGLDDGFITGIPNGAIDETNYVLTATTYNDYTKTLDISIKVDGFNYTEDGSQPIVDLYLDRPITIKLYKNDGYSNFTVAPALPNGLSLNSTSGTISGIVKNVDTRGYESITLTCNITGSRNPTVTVPISIKIYCYPCPQHVILPREIGTFNTRAMRYSAIVNSSSRQIGRMRYIANSGTNINRTYEEPPRNKF